MPRRASSPTTRRSGAGSPWCTAPRSAGPGSSSPSSPGVPGACAACSRGRRKALPPAPRPACFRRSAAWWGPRWPWRLFPCCGVRPTPGSSTAGTPGGEHAVQFRSREIPRAPLAPKRHPIHQGADPMPVTVKIPAPLRPLTANQGEVAVENAGTVQAALEELSRKYPGLKDKLLDDKGALRRYVNLFRNEEDARHAQGLGTALKEGDRLTIVPDIAGGC